MLRSEDEIGVVKDGRLIARLTIEPAQELAARPPLPDFLGGMRANFGDRMLDTTGSEIISDDRDGR